VGPGPQTPNPQSPIPNPQSPTYLNFFYKKLYSKNNLINK